MPNASTKSTAAAVRKYGTDLTVAFDREIVPNVAVAALNLIYQPEWTRFVGTGAAEQESTIGAAFAVMAQLRPGFLFGGEARYLRKYEGIGLEEFSGQALFIGPTAYFQLSERSRLDRKLERPGLGTSGRIGSLPRSRQFRTAPGPAGVRRQLLRLCSKALADLLILRQAPHRIFTVV